MKSHTWQTILFKAADLIVVLGMLLSGPTTALAYTWAEPPDATPGSTVTISGQNSDGVVYQEDRLVQVDVLGPLEKTYQCIDDTVEAGGVWSCQITLVSGLEAVGDYTYTASQYNDLNELVIIESGAFSDAVGDFSLNFVASAPYSYNHLVGGGAYDDRTVGKHADIVESLEAIDFSCGDTVTYLTQVTVDNTARADTDAPQTIELDYEFLMDTTGQPGVALGDITYVGVNYPPIVDLIAGEDTIDQGISDDGGSVATLISESQTGPMFTKGAKLQGTIQLTDLERNEKVVVRVDVKLFCKPGQYPTGNLQADITGGRLTFIKGTTPVTPPAKLSVGNQTIPFRQFGDIHYPQIDIQKTVTTADGTCPGTESLEIHTGDTVKYCYVVSNPSNLSNPPGAPLYNVSVVDDNRTPLNSSDDFFVTLTGLTDIDLDGQADDLAAGANATGVASVLITGSAGTYTNTATARGDDSILMPTTLTDTDTASVVILFVPAPAISINKTTNGSDGPTILIGQPITWSYVVTNTGNVALSSVAVSDDKGVSVTCPKTSLAVGESMTCTASGTAVAGDYSNTGTASGVYGTTTVTASDPSSYFGADPKIDIQKTPDTQTVIEGGTATFTIVVTNTGNVSLTNVSVTDPLAANCVKTIGSLGVGASSTYTCSLSNLTNGFTNVAYVSGTYGSTTVTDNDDAVVVIDYLPKIAVTKTANPTAVPETGGDVLFTFKVTNNSVEPVTITSLADNVYGTLTGDDDCQVGTVLAAGASCEFSITRWVDGDYSGPDHVNVFTAHAEDKEKHDASDDDDATVDFTNVPPTIEVTKTANPTAVPETGGDVLFTFVVKNTSTEEPVTITSLADSVYGTLTGDDDCQVGTVLAAGVSCEFSITRWVDGDYSGPDHVNVFTAHAEDNDKTDVKDDDDATVDFTNVPPTIEVTKTANPTAVPETGGDVLFTFVVKNTSTEEPVTITSLADNVYGTLTGDNDCQVGTVLAAGTSCEFSITRWVDGDYSGPDHVNVFTAHAEDNDKTDVKDDDDATVDFTNVPPTIEVTKTANPTAVPETGGNVLFTFVVKNTSTEEPVTITSLADSVYGTLTGDDDCQVGTVLAAGTSCEFSITRWVDGDYSGLDHVNIFTAHAEDNDKTDVKDDDDATVDFTDVLPTVDLTKSVDSNGTFNVGDTATFTLTIKNTSLEIVTITALTDTNTLSAECAALVGTTLAAGASVSCTYTVVHNTAGTYPNTADVTVEDNEENQAYDTAVQSIIVYAPVISKTANGKYDEVHDWEVFKSVNTASQTAFAGEKKNFTWTVRVDETTHGENYLVTGKITVVNPNPDDALTVALSDKLNDGSVAAIGPCTDGTWASPNLTVPAGGTAVCDYSVTPKGDLNALAAALPAQVTINSVNPGPESYWLTTVSGGGALNGTYEGWCADIDRTMNPGTNYTANVYSSYETLPAGLIEKAYNLDLVNWIINQDYVGKPAGGSLGNYTYGDVQRAIWELIEDNPTASTAGLGSWNQNRVNQIKAAATDKGEGFQPTCGDFVAVILAPVDSSQAIAIAQVTFASLGLDCAVSNAVTAVLNGISFPASANIIWYVTKINESATLDDDQSSTFPTTVSADTTFTYQDPQGYTCSTDPIAYTDGFYQYNESNRAVLTYSTGSDSATASTAVKCYAPVVSKTAAGAYDERHEWDVEKSVSPASQNAFPGDTVSYTWTVKVVESVFEENFAVTGTVSIKNPRPDAAMLVSLSDVLNDTPGTPATITGCAVGTWNSTNKTVSIPASSTAMCDYSAAPTGRTASLNTATVKLNALTATATASVGWTANVIRPSATLDDDQNPAFPLNITDGGTWTYKDSYTCSTDGTKYTGDDKTYSFTDSNTAIVTSGDERDSSSASSAVNCYWPQIELTKTGDALSKIGDPVTYNILLENKTPTSAGLGPLSCTITDSVIAINKTVTLASGARDTTTKAQTIPTGASDPYVNTANVICYTHAPQNGFTYFSVSDSSTWSTNLFQPKVEIVKSGPLYATPGDVITYTFIITNKSSSDSPNLILDTLSDNVLGDLKAAALAAGCDNLVYNGTCTFTKQYTVPDVGLQAIKQTNVVTVHYHPYEFPNDISDTDDHTVTITPKSQLTDTSYCPLPNNQFRLLYHLDVAPNIYRLQASNPGQFYMNAFYYGAPGSAFSMTIQVPYPFVTQEGAGNPIQVHDGTGLTSSGCYIPTPSLSGFTITTPAMIPTSSAGNQIITPEDYAKTLMGETTTVTVSGVVPATGMAYVTIHLDYGLKKTSGWKNPGTATLNPVTNTSIPDMTNGNGSGPITIHGYEVYSFARTVGGDTSTTTPSSYNEIKKFAGFLGIVTDSDTGNPLKNVKVVIYTPLGKVLATVYTDEDGYYMYAYKHTAKSATYTIKLPAYGKSVTRLVKANGFAVADFEIP